MKDKKKHHGAMDEYSSEQQFHKSPLLCEKSEAILLLLVDLTAVSPAGRPAVWQVVRRNTGRFENF